MGRGTSDPVPDLERTFFPIYPAEYYIERSLQQRRRAAQLSVDYWRKSIIGLINLSEKNLRLAIRYMELGDFKAAVQAAYTSTENIARALIHCCGGKPDSSMGQEEALRMLSRRFKGNERIFFKKAIENIAFIEYTKCNRQKQHFDKAITNRILKSASKARSLFMRIIIKNFVKEIPQLSERCPKCHSLDYSIWNFTQNRTRYNCNVCNHKWTGSRISNLNSETLNSEIV
jgi:DNA-directed RNA polymerase subunit M/transcription elongation factor TFIIS